MLSAGEVGVDVAEGVTSALREAAGLVEALVGVGAPADGESPTCEAARADDAVPTGAAETLLGLTSSGSPAGDSPAVRCVRLRPSCVPSDDEEEGEDGERAKPAISAATDAAPSAPTATATCFARRPVVSRAARRRSARPGPGCTGATGAIRGSSRVSS